MYVKKCPWLKSHWERADVGEDIDKNVLPMKIILGLILINHKRFAVLCVLWVQPSPPNPRVLLGSCLGLHLGL